MDDAMGAVLSGKPFKEPVTALSAACDEEDPGTQTERFGGRHLQSPTQTQARPNLREPDRLAEPQHPPMRPVPSDFQPSVGSLVTRYIYTSPKPRISLTGPTTSSRSLTSWDMFETYLAEAAKAGR